MVTTTPQESLKELWESIPEDLRPSGPYTVDALSSAVASLVAKAQQVSQCGHKDELANALGGVRTTNGSWQDLLELTRQAAWQSSQELKGDMPKPFTGSPSDYRRWKAEIRNWAILNGAAPGETLAAAVLLNMTGHAKRWSLIRDPSQYSMIDGVPASAAVTLEAIIVDMNALFIDAGARERARRKYDNARQGTRGIFEYNIYYHNLIVELGYDKNGFSSSMLISEYIKTLRPDLRDRMEKWHFTQEVREESTT